MSQIEFSKNMKLYATPTFIFLNHDESVIGNKPGFIDTKELADLLRYVHTDAYLTQSYQEFIEQQ